MKLPALLSKVTVDFAPEFFHAYPPLGFYPIEEYQLGNGDVFGLYWPIDKEDLEPLVVETWHDSWEIAPHYSSLDTFVNAMESLGEQDHLGTPVLKSDPQSPLACFSAARAKLGRQEVESAILLLETAIRILPLGA